MRDPEKFTIRQMIELTGLTEFTIRGWENRYTAFTPRRSGSGRREYLKSDIERALLLRELLKRGYKIGKIAALNKNKLESLFAGSDQKQDLHTTETGTDIAFQAMELMALQKWSDLEHLIKSVPVKSSRSIIDQFFLPVLRALTKNINAGLVSISQEHVLSSFLKEKIYSSLNELDSKKKDFGQNNSGRFVLAAPEGDFHETGLLLAHLMIRSFGFVSLYLGPHSPAQDLAETALRFRASHVLIVTTVSRKNGALYDPLHYISDVQKKVGPTVRILVAGAHTPSELDFATHLSFIRDFPALTQYLENMRSH